MAPTDVANIFLVHSDGEVRLLGYSYATVYERGIFRLESAEARGEHEVHGVHALSRTGEKEVVHVGGHDADA